jgi:DHA3 family tetracycline resistance protein-like MFS transporter
MTRETPDRLRALRPLATRDYRLLFAAVGIEVFGTGMWTIVMVFQVLALDDSPLPCQPSLPGSASASSLSRSSAGW